MDLYGLDGCKRNSWVVAKSSDDLRSITFDLVDNIQPLFEAAASHKAVVVLDVPIGLSHEDRKCDKAARALLGRDGASRVFRPPCREALLASSYEQAKAINRQHCEVGISQQAYHIGGRIKTVDQIITPGHQDRVREGHPEVVFAMLNGALPLTHSKDSRQGVAERMALLAAGVPVFDPIKERIRLGRGTVATDDIVDAAAMLLTAKHVANETAA